MRLLSRNTLFTGTVLLALLYFPQRLQSLLPAAIQISIPSKVLIWFKALSAVSFLRDLNYYLSDQVLNNWKSDPWRHGEEIVLVTGGSSGMGEKMVVALSKSSRAVIVLDLQPSKSLRKFHLKESKHHF